MTASAPAWPSMSYDSLPIPAAVFELLAYLIVGTASVLAFVTGWLSINAAVVLTVLLLGSLIALSWIHLGHGRHPVFLFLCTLTLFQGGRLIAYCVGVEPTPMHIILLNANFDISRQQQGTVLLCVALAALFVYAPARWAYRDVPPTNSIKFEKYLPYLYLVFAITWPALIFKSYEYYDYVMSHGGYLSFFVNHSAVKATVPFIVRALSLLPYPVLIAILVIEQRKSLVWLLSILYLGATAIMLAFGSRGGTVTLLLTIWWISRIRTRRRPRLLAIAFVMVVLLFLVDSVRHQREQSNPGIMGFAPIQAISIEGAPLNMTEMAVKYRSHFEHYSFSYLLYELRSGFVGIDNLHYAPGQSLDLDASTFLNPELFNQGNRVASSYIGEAYIAGGMPAVVVVSLLIGWALSAIFARCDRPGYVLLLALVLQDVLVMPRAQLLDWLTILFRNLLMLASAWIGWNFYQLLAGVRDVSSQSQIGISAGPPAQT
ncbi:MAG TPA: O-antigen polysaccharide polymerase Wzy [Terriglobales bacterium]|nr:O-antigen polysaccharide polymerase Wzy [Terriglobales bacterium]